MLEYLRSEKQFLIVLLFWVIVGMMFAPLTWVVIPVTLLLFQRKKMYLEMLLGFLLILILSDSRQYAMHFAGDIKDIYLLLMTFFFFADRKSFVPAERFVYRFVPFIVLAVFFLIFSEIFLTSAQKTLSYLLVFLVVPNYLAAAWRVHGSDALRRLIWIGVLVLFVGFAIRVISPGFVILSGRYSGLFGNPNGLGLFCIIFFILFTVSGDIVNELFDRRDRYVILGAIFLSAVLCGSRNAVFTIGIFVMFRYFYRISPFLGIMTFLIVVLVYQLILANFEGIIIALDLQEYFRLETFQSASGRIVAWEFGWDHIQENPLLGKGIGYTEYLYRKNYDVLSIMGHQGNAHNSYITFWLDTGILGLLAYLIAFISTFVSAASRTRSAIPAMFAILFSAFFESWLTASLNPFTIQFVIIGTILISPVFREQGVEEPASEELEPELDSDEIEPVV